MKSKNLRIIKGHGWYKNFVGHVYEIVEEDFIQEAYLVKTWYTTEDDIRMKLCVVFKEDCEIEISEKVVQ
ncbi:hypothetical protein ACLH26_15405 [Bacillus subtilis]|uniref:hypothetical protein n=1 Tax=Bacillus subtilis TaxID=1423 RepID=UPI003982EF64